MNTIRDLVNANELVIAAGGGGVPVVETESGLSGVPAVIDKDRSSALLANDLGADKLIILTAVDYVAINFNKPNQENLTDLSVADAKKYINEKQFAAGSMLPKIEACLAFVEGHPERQAIVTSLENLDAALAGEIGTVIHA